MIRAVVDNPCRNVHPMVSLHHRPDDLRANKKHCTWGKYHCSLSAVRLVSGNAICIVALIQASSRPLVSMRNGDSLFLVGNICDMLQLLHMQRRRSAHVTTDLETYCKSVQAPCKVTACRFVADLDA